MLFTTPTQFAVLLLMLVIGWLFGLASHPGGKKWKQSYRDEQAARTRDVADRDAKIQELEARNAELAAERDTARSTAPVAASSATAAVPRAQPLPVRDPVDAGRDDDLTRLRGVDGELAGLFRSEGIGSYATIAALSGQDELALERRMDLPAGYIARERLSEQAALLAAGQSEEHARTYR